MGKDWRKWGGAAACLWLAACLPQQGNGAGVFDQVLLCGDAGALETPATLWLAQTDSQRRQGYQVLPAPAPREGMLFAYGEEAVRQGFWMRRVSFPLDLALLDRERRIVWLATMAPCPDAAPDCPLYGQGQRYQYAIEAAAGAMAAWQWQIGMPLDWRDPGQGCPSGRE